MYPKQHNVHEKSGLDELRIGNPDHRKTSLDEPGVGNAPGIQKDLGFVGTRPGVAEEEKWLVPGNVLNLPT